MWFAVDYAWADVELLGASDCAAPAILRVTQAHMGPALGARPRVVAEAVLGTGRDQASAPDSRAEGTWPAPFRDAATLEHFVDRYRKAGLPE